MSDLYTYAQHAHDLGFVVIPPAHDKTKRPDGGTDWQDRVVTAADLERWYLIEQRTGFGVICGTRSMGRELFEFEARACPDLYNRFLDTAADRGLGGLVNKIRYGYTETSPTGGTHWLFRVDEPSPQNGALAARLTDEGIRPLIECKTTGGYAVLAPSSGAMLHETGKPWVLQSGSLDTIADITPDERDALHALAREFDELPPPVPRTPKPKCERKPGELSPGDDFDDRADWASDVLEPAGWTYVTTKGESEYWRRPGKPEGTSATLNYKGNGLLAVWSSSTPFNVHDKNDKATNYGPFRAYAMLFHGGDESAAAKELRARGYGSAPVSVTLPPIKPCSTGTDAAPNLARPARRGAIKITPLRNVRSSHADTFWDRRCGREHITVFAGDGGVGKSTVRDYLVAAITGGAPFPGWGDGDNTPHGDVVILTYEDAASNIRQRLEVLGADIDRVYILEGRTTTDEEGNTALAAITTGDLRAVEREIEAAVPNPVMFSIDPWKNLMGDINDPKNVNPVMTELQSLSVRLNIATVIVAHFNANGQVAGYRGLIDQARSRVEFRVTDGENADVTKVAAIHEKGSIAGKADALTYEFHRMPDKRGWHTGDNPLHWTGTTNVTSQYLLRDKQASKLQQAEDWLRRTVRDGPMPSKVVEALGREEGIAPQTLRTARERLVDVIRHADGTTQWALK